MNTSAVLPEILGNFLPQLPVILACAVACVVILAGAQKGSRAALWALLGFGLALGVCLASPIVFVVVRRLVMSGNGPPRMPAVFTGLSLFWSCLRAGSYVCLLLAILAGRPASAAAPPPRR